MKSFVAIAVVAVSAAFALDATAQPSTSERAQPPVGRPGPMGMGRMGPGFTPGWSLMTPAERDEHRARMRGATSGDECRSIAAEHRKQMEERAKERGTTLRMPRRDACAAWRG